MIRALTPAERALAQGLFGDAVAPCDVRLLALPWPFSRAFVPGRWFGRDWICWPRARLVTDIGRAPLSLQAVLVHELVHVWQAQSGINLLWAKIRAGDGAAAYRYPTTDDCRFDDLNIEQQAMMVEHAFRLRRGGTAPRTFEFYARRLRPLFALDAGDEDPQFRNR